MLALVGDFALLMNTKGADFESVTWDIPWASDLLIGLHGWLRAPVYLKKVSAW